MYSIKKIKHATNYPFHSMVRESEITHPINLGQLNTVTQTSYDQLSFSHFGA